MSKNERHASEKQGLKTNALFCAFVFLTFGVYIGLDLLTPYFFGEAWSGPFLTILLVGQLTLICVWGTLVEGTFWFRLPWTILLLVVSWAALCTGVYLDSGLVDPEVIMALGLVWFYGFGISYIPLKIAAWSFGWRIQLLRKDPLQRGTGRFAIRDIMLGTAILAVTLAIGRRFLPEELPPWSEVLARSGLRSPDFLIGFLVFSIISLVVKLPCIWIALAVADNKILRQSLIWVYCSGALGFVETLILTSIFPTGNNYFEILFSFVFGHALMATSMLGVLWGLRSFGYRLIRSKGKPLGTAE